MPEFTGVLTVIAALIPIFCFLIFIYFFGVWIQCKTTRTPVSFLDLIRLKLGRIDIGMMVAAMILSTQGGLGLKLRDYVAHHRKGGHVLDIAKTLIISKKMGIGLDFEKACEMDLDPEQDLLAYVKHEVEQREGESLPP